MPRWDDSGGRVKQTLFECAAFQYGVRAICGEAGCRHTVIFDPHALWWLFERSGWDDHLRAASQRLRCDKCGSRGAKLEPVTAAPTVDRLPLPPPHEWKRAVNRFRC